LESYQRQPVEKPEEILMVAKKPKEKAEKEKSSVTEVVIIFNPNN
jgi:hypothetical protein